MSTQRPARAPAPVPFPAVHHDIRHESAHAHVAGTARYVDDMPEPAGLLHAALGQSRIAHGRILSMDLSAVRAYPGVVAVLTAADVPGVNDVGPVVADDPIFADGLVEYVGQSLFAVAATSRQAARAAARLAKVEYEERPAIVTIAQARAADSHLLPPRRVQRGDPESVIAAAPHRLSGHIVIGGQDHFYLEGQISLATPGEDGDMHILCSTQHPSEVQHLVARALGRPDNAVVVEVRRMGGAFGGKETQASLFAAASALLADRTGRPVKLRLDRDDDMVMTGKRHDFETRYSVGFDDQGHILGLDITLESRCGMSTDLSGAINDRALFHCDNCYFLPDIRITSYRYKTHTVSNTAFRGFGGPQGMVGIEQVIDDIARHRGLDPLDVRLANLYGGPGRDITPYGMRVEDNVAPQIIQRLADSAQYRERRAALADFNRTSPILKRGLALTPVKFGISFTTSFLNQGGALVHLYADGSVMLNHGGTEMGQGLYTKVAQVVADAFGIGLDRVRVTSTRTDKVPNTSATAASAGTDLNGMAAYNAAIIIRDRLAGMLAERWGVDVADIRFADGKATGGGQEIAFDDLARQAYLARLSLSATGFYATPKIDVDKQTLIGRPFYYFAYGAALSEVVIDTLTGENKLLAVDILHDCGKSLNPVLDRGQIEGGFIQGMGWLTMEELVFDAAGRLRTHAPSTYKIPGCGDVPDHFNVTLCDWPNGEDTIHRSKAVGEPPLMLAISVLHALKDAVAACGGSGPVLLDAPATPERILLAVTARQRQGRGQA
ncbi:xanthine dehydrogenase molybdopterin binding subunit [Niveispirillum sp. SYP-B3756]|uniref:xanthine dehydrogenase molybdopterin binding subunit n=1 Tax=Niveispirillum sp. SYP-B3756 TaxID=2662178 RepID=UPI0012927626|nr:xanthine dehydrogenase molybdopterin binding subunit [Niveispirillum sp. SYP-B3756]MQP64872.1 xanthine dehydrogenase molybdopterin binding subunit [Niveispirillum sp. SYP-B3756]